MWGIEGDGSGAGSTFKQIRQTMDSLHEFIFITYINFWNSKDLKVCLRHSFRW